MSRSVATLLALLTSLLIGIATPLPVLQPAAIGAPHPSFLPPAAILSNSTGPPPIGYDEQIGITFAQDSAAVKYNVTALAQADSDGYGPAYLVNGLTDEGYWYQFGIAYDWPYTTGGFVPGFTAIYAIFNSTQAVVYPPGGEYNFQFSGPVNSADTVLLSLSFSAGNLTMNARDWNTGSMATVTYWAEGTRFVGLYTQNDRGTFTGLMTEWYHAHPYYGSEKMVVYSDASTPLTAGYLWVDEYDARSPSSVFFNDYSYFAFDSPHRILSIGQEGAEAYADAYTFITGALNGYLLTLDYSVAGGGAGFSPPTLTYSYEGVPKVSVLTTTPGSVIADAGSRWEVSRALPGGSSGERWETPDVTNGTLTGSMTGNLTYFHQFFVQTSYSVVGGGSPSSPEFSGTSFGSPMALTLDRGVEGAWLDRGSNWNATNPLGGSNTHERWYANPPVGGEVTGPRSVSLAYVHQYFVTIVAEPADGGKVTPPSEWMGAGTMVEIRGVPSQGWKFVGWTGIGTGAYTGGTGSAQLLVNGPLNESATLYPGLTLMIGSGGEVSFAGGNLTGKVGGSASTTIYAPSGTNISLTAIPDVFYTFGGWANRTAGTSRISLTLTNPQSAQVSFSTDWREIALLGAGLLGVVGTAAVLIWRRRGLKGAQSGSDHLERVLGSPMVNKLKKEKAANLTR
jgi:hypothetical protein